MESEREKNTKASCAELLFGSSPFLLKSLAFTHMFIWSILEFWNIHKYTKQMYSPNHSSYEHIGMKKMKKQRRKTDPEHLSRDLSNLFQILLI